MTREEVTTPFEVFIGRQPIYDRNLELVSHELLFRSSRENSARFAEGGRATSQLLIHSLLDIGLDKVAGDGKVYVNLPQDVILSSVVELLPPQRWVLEILETVAFTPEVLAALERFKRRGFELALDDFLPSAERDRALQLADVVKLDLRALGMANLAGHARAAKKYGARLLAEKIESRSEFEACRRLGFDYFQGYFLSRPEVIPGKSSPVDLMALTLLVERCHDPMADVSAITHLVAQSASISYRLLQAANSAFHARQAHITSVRDAVLFLGIGFVAKLASLFLLSGLGNKPSASLLLALQRACMCERLATDRLDSNQLYMVGLLSALDFLLDQPIAAIIEPLPLADDLKDAIVKREGPMGRILAGVVAYEEQDWAALERCRFDPRPLSNAYWSAAPQLEQFRRLLERELR